MQMGHTLSSASSPVGAGECDRSRELTRSGVQYGCLEALRGGGVQHLDADDGVPFAAEPTTERVLDPLLDGRGGVERPRRGGVDRQSTAPREKRTASSSRPSVCRGGALCLVRASVGVRSSDFVSSLSGVAHGRLSARSLRRASSAASMVVWCRIPTAARSNFLANTQRWGCALLMKNLCGISDTHRKIPTVRMSYKSRSLRGYTP